MGKVVNLAEIYMPILHLKTSFFYKKKCNFYMRSMLNLQFLPAFQYGKKFMLKNCFFKQKM